MKIRITAPGIFGQDGEIAVGTEFEVDIEPVAWVGKYVILEDNPPAEAVKVENQAKK